ncbi:MAG: SlyX family protein [Methylococcales bacterium]|jgi:SlyX protein|nr:SlyX family protein [Methylococcales bacterium]MBT7443171.1 SlyX family protein [Methylococcales bacterium]
MEDAIIELESKIAFQEDTIQTLDRVVIGQQSSIDWLVKEVKLLQSQVKNLTPSIMAKESEETPPPHY